MAEKKKVYVETTVVSNLTYPLTRSVTALRCHSRGARPSHNPVDAVAQIASHERS